MPIVWHVIQLYARPGLSPLPARHRLPRRADRALRRRRASGRRASSVDVRGHGPGDADRRADQALAPALSAGEERSALTYADGLADIDLRRAARVPREPRRAREHDRRAPAAAVRRHRDRRATAACAASARSPRSEHWINGGFFCFAAGVLDRAGAATACSSASRWSGWRPTGELRAYRHEGFWECMDTYKDAVALNDLWAVGRGAVAPREQGDGARAASPRAPRRRRRTRGTAAPARGCPRRRRSPAKDQRKASPAPTRAPRARRARCPGGRRR